MDVLAAERKRADWLFLPRGDEANQRTLMAQALAKSTLDVLDDLVDQAVARALQSSSSTAPRVREAVRRQSQMKPQLVVRQQQEVKKRERALNLTKEQALAKEIVRSWHR